MNPQKILQKKYGWIVLLILFALLILLSAQLHTRIDLTKEKRYSLSTSTKQLLNQLEGDVEIKVLLSGKLSAGFRKLKNSTSELLENFRSYSNGHLHFTFINPGEGLSDSLKLQLYDSLVHMGIKPFNNQLQESDDAQTERIIFPAAIVEYNGKLIPVDLMSGKSGMDEESTLNYSEALLEFKFDDAIQKLTTKQFPVVAYAVGNGEPLNPTVNDLFTTLSNNYRFGIFDLKNGILNADTIKALMIVKPQTAFTEDEKIKIDQYIMQGGNVLWFIDRLYAEFDSLLRAKSDFVAFDKGLNIDDQLFKYGVRINPDLLQDLNSAKQPLVVGNMGGQPQIQRIPFPYYPLLTAPENHPISRNLDQVLSIFPSSIDTVEAKGIKKTVLLATDTSSRKLGTPAIVSLRSIRSEGDLQTFTDSKVPVVVLLEGKFKSLYANRFDKAMQDSVEKLTGVPFMSQGEKVARQIVASDADIVTNVVTQSNGPLPMGTQQFENYQFANKEFLLNCLDYLVGNRGIIETRNKEFTLRLLDKAKVKDNKTFWQFINIVVPIVIILLLGIILQWYRKKTYTNI
ncbi:gliding motility-associated ABC transporter substrate-binding protein GldG [Hydrotalea sandarakina]|jgi:gliding-associated putative ABC transporter substrate-binding component GldG|uniref:Gliding-associated putative ABC transporter substrate-binding component GldG n=1 Tax=Hydrotalea sandarakina TaxID=1004304 RepID=A0A2W7S0U3_9BACT|nr:gliding motility-associated ABC transporter substrate-binding protein GldG [Hydrotalea sandarakina]PZX64576.1 gliding-associated putative ABC transporter substrate-binding component GldG [Hydrotalea sandarakina]